MFRFCRARRRRIANRSSDSERARPGSLCPHEHAHEISRPLVGGSPQFSRQNSMDRRTKKPTTKKKPPSKKAMQIKKDAERAKAAADPFATPGSARATLAAHRNKVKKDKSVKNKVYKEATVAYFHGTNAHFKHALIEGLGVGKVAAVFSVRLPVFHNRRGQGLDCGVRAAPG